MDQLKLDANRTTSSAGDPRDSLKMTEIGELPDDWHVADLGSVATLIMGQSPPSSTYNTRGSGLPFLQGKAEFGRVFPVPAKWCNAPLRIAPHNSILLSVRAPVGNVNLAPEECCIGRGLAALVAGHDIDTAFLFFSLRFARQRLEDQGTGSTFKSINKGTLKGFRIALPPLPEQRAIARVLRTVQEAIEATERVIEAAKELKRSMMEYLFTYGPVPVDQADQVELNSTTAGSSPVHWEEASCEELCRQVTVGVVVKPASYYVEEGVPAFRSFNVKEDRLNADALVFFSEEANEGKLAKSKVRKGDVLIVRTGAPGTACVVPEQFDGANCIDLVIARPNQEVVRSAYLSRFLNSSRGKKQALSSKTGLAQQHLNVGAVKGLRVMLPQLAEQDQVISLLGSADSYAEALSKRLVALEELFSALLHNLMTGRIRVTPTEQDMEAGE